MSSLECGSTCAQNRQLILQELAANSAALAAEDAAGRSPEEQRRFPDVDAALMKEHMRPETISLIAKHRLQNQFVRYALAADYADGIRTQCGIFRFVRDVGVTRPLPALVVYHKQGGRIWYRVYPFQKGDAEWQITLSKTFHEDGFLHTVENGGISYLNRIIPSLPEPAPDRTIVNPTSASDQKEPAQSEADKNTHDDSATSTGPVGVFESDYVPGPFEMDFSRFVLRTIVDPKTGQTNTVIGTTT